MFAVVVTTLDELKISWTVTFLFDDDTWGNLWRELGVSEEDWAAWEQGRPNVHLAPSVLILSDLIYIVEDTISLDPGALERECTQVLPTIIRSDVRALIEALLSTAKSAIEMGGEVAVFYAASGERVGDHRSKKLPQP
jgi:hypothetical protein